MILYIDPRGDPDDPATTHFGIAGYAAQEDRWAEFEREWGAVLAENGLRRFHMADREFRHEDGSLHRNYRHKTADHWIEVKKTLAAIIRRHTDSGFGVAHDLAALRKIITPTIIALARRRPDHQATIMFRLGDPLAIALQCVIAYVLDYCRPVIRPGEILKVICDNEKSGPKGRLMQAYEDVRAMLFRLLCRKLNSFTGRAAGNRR